MPAQFLRRNHTRNLYYAKPALAVQTLAILFFDSWDTSDNDPALHVASRSPVRKLCVKAIGFRSATLSGDRNARRVDHAGHPSGVPRLPVCHSYWRGGHVYQHSSYYV
jgi:hypothetical protein